MKKTFSCILVAIVFISSCAKGKDLGIYDNTIPVDTQTKLAISYYLTITNFDGKKVRWGPSLFHLAVVGEVPKNTIFIPSGKHTLTQIIM